MRTYEIHLASQSPLIYDIEQIDGDLTGSFADNDGRLQHLSGDNTAALRKALRDGIVAEPSEAKSGTTWQIESEDEDAD